MGSFRKPRETGRGGDVGVRKQALLLSCLALPLLVGSYVLVLTLWSRPAAPGREVRLDEFLGLLAGKQVQSAVILPTDERIAGRSLRGDFWVDVSGGHESLFARLTGAMEQAGVPFSVRRQPLRQLLGPVSTVLPALIGVDALLIVILLASRGGAGGFGRSGARRADPAGSLTFTDLAGVDEAVEELAEVAQYLAQPQRFASMGAAVPKGVLLEGRPGVGKTGLARALAGEAGVPFFSISGSDFVEMFVGVGAARIRDLFAAAKAEAPAIVFIDELDAAGRARSGSTLGGSDEREAALNQLLVEMDGFDSASGVVVVAATNRADILDAALLRPGRFDRRIRLDLPDLRGRRAILDLHARGKRLAPDADLAAVASRTAGFSGADLANLLNEAALLASRGNSQEISSAHLSQALERVVGGPLRPGRCSPPKTDGASPSTRRARRSSPRPWPTATAWARSPSWPGADRGASPGTSPTPTACSRPAASSKSASPVCWEGGLPKNLPWESSPPGRPTTSNGPPPSPVAWSGSTG